MKITLTEIFVCVAILIIIVAMSWAAVTKSTREDEIIRGCESPSFVKEISQTNGSLHDGTGHVYTTTEYVYRCADGRTIKVSRWLDQ